MVKLGKSKPGKTWENLGKPGKTWENLGKPGKTWENLVQRTKTEAVQVPSSIKTFMSMIV